MYFAAQRTDYPGSERLVETKGVTNRVYRLANTQCFGGTHLYGKQFFARRLDLQYRQILFSSIPHQRCWPGSAICQRHLQSIGALYDVKIGHYVAVPVPNKAGARTTRYLRHIAAEIIAAQLGGSDVANRRCCRFEEPDGVALNRGQRIIGRSIICQCRWVYRPGLVDENRRIVLRSTF